MADDNVAGEDPAYADVVLGRKPPDLSSYQEGWAAHASGKGFHEGPRPFFTVGAVSWRIGWNDRALTFPEPESCMKAQP